MKQFVFTPMILFFLIILSACSAETNLLKTNKDPLLGSKFTETDIIFYTKYPKVEIVQKLIKKGFNIDFQDSEGYSALMAAAENDDAEIMSLLIENGATVDLQDNNGETALLMAVRNGSYSVIPLLINAGANPNLVDNQNKGLLMHAFDSFYGRKNDDIPKVLMALHENNVRFRDLPFYNEKGYSPLAVAIANYEPKIIEILAMSGSALDVHNIDNLSVLQNITDISNGYVRTELSSRSNAQIIQCLLYTYTNLSPVQIFGIDRFSDEELTLVCKRSFEDYDYTLINGTKIISNKENSSPYKDPETNNSIDISQIVEKFVNEKIITLNDIDFKFKQTLTESDLKNMFGEPYNVSEEYYKYYDYYDFSISLDENNELVGAVYSNLNLSEQELLKKLGKPDFFKEQNEHDQKIYGYNVYFNGEEKGENYISLRFAFYLDGQLEYFGIN